MPRQPVQMGANLAFVEGEFGGPITEQETEVTVGLTPLRIVDNNPEALALSIINLGTEGVYLAPSDLVSSSRGIFLESGGGLFSLNVRDDQGLPAREWWAVAETSSSILYIVRNYRYAYTT